MGVTALHTPSLCTPSFTLSDLAQYFALARVSLPPTTPCMHRKLAPQISPNLIWAVFPAKSGEALFAVSHPPSQLVSSTYLSSEDYSGQEALRAFTQLAYFTIHNLVAHIYHISQPHTNIPLTQHQCFDMLLFTRGTRWCQVVSPGATWYHWRKFAF